MLDFLSNSSLTQDSLSHDERGAIIAATRVMPGAWSVQCDEFPNGESFACILPPWGDGITSAFLLERQGNLVVVTDRLSDPARDLFSTYDGVSEAMTSVLGTVLGSAAAGPST